MYGSNLPYILLNILQIRDLTVDTYSIVYLPWEKLVENVYLGYLSEACINMVLAIVTKILMVCSAAPF